MALASYIPKPNERHAAPMTRPGKDITAAPSARPFRFRRVETADNAYPAHRPVRNDGWILRRSIAPIRLARRLCAVPRFGLGIALSLALTGCAYIPRTVPGLPPGDPWTALPLRAWIADKEIEAEAITGCFTPECPQRVAVGLFRARGTAADVLARLLADPAPLARAVAEGRPRPGLARPRRLAAGAETLTLGSFRAVLVTMLPPVVPAKPSARGLEPVAAKPGHILLAGRPEGDGIWRVLLAAGASRDAALHAAGEAIAALR